MPNLSADEIFEQYKKETAEFPGDLKYREDLAKAIGLPRAEAHILRPIIGQEEFQSLMKQYKRKDFQPGIRKYDDVCDSHDYRYLNSGEFHANLHIHSTHSDGLISVQKLLRHSNAIAERNAKKFPEHKAPFMIALTDHDCVDGVRELLNLVAKNPEKYKNLRIVLGVEVSIIANTMKFQNKETSIHLHMLAINPYDKKLFDFLERKRHLKYELAQQTNTALNKELAPVLKELKIEFSIKEAAKIHEMILKGLDEVSRPLKKYTFSKLLFSYYVENFNPVKKILTESGIEAGNLSLERAMRGYLHLFRRPEGFVFNYKEGLSRYLSDEVKAKIGKIYNFEELVKDTPQYLLDAIEKCRKICEYSHPSMNHMPEAFSGFEDTIDYLYGVEYGVFSIAHPGRTLVKDFDKSIDEIFSDMFSLFKKHGKNKAFSCEGCYQSYQGGTWLKYQESIEKNAEKYGLVQIGGLDSHGPNVISRYPWF